MQVIEGSSSCFDYLFLRYVDDHGPSLLYHEIGIPYLGKIKDWFVRVGDNYLIVVESVSLTIKLVEVIFGSVGNSLSYIHPTAAQSWGIL